jgi:hypothetical protein
MSQHRRTPRACGDSRIAHALKLRNSAGVIEMHVRIQNQFHILNAEAQRLNVRSDLAGRLGQGTINQDVTGIRSDQD